MITSFQGSTGNTVDTATHLGIRTGAIVPRMRREPWIQTCAERLAELNPLLDPVFWVAHAADLWVDVGSYDPVIAAEMEHEAGIFDH